MIRTNLLENENNLKLIITRYLADEISRVEFSELYRVAYEKYEETLDERCTSILSVLVPTERNSEEAWKRSAIHLYQNDIRRLEESLKVKVPSYSESLTDEKLLESCKLALSHLSNEMQDRVAKEWIKENLVDDVYFVFFHNDGKSKFGNHVELYQIRLEHESFLLTALAGNLERPSFKYARLLEILLTNISNTQNAMWVQCSEIDGVLAAINISSHVNANLEAILEASLLSACWIEHTTSSDTQGGRCHLLLLPIDFTWMLKISNDFQTFKIELHGSKEFIDSVLVVL